MRRLSGMSSRLDKQKKSPPPLPLNVVPPPQQPARLPPNARPVGQQRNHQHARNMLSSTTQGQSSADTTPVDLTGTRVVHSSSSRSRNAMATLTNFMEQARVSSPLKSEPGSTVGSRRGSTTRSRQSGRSQQSAAVAQAQLEAFDEKTARSEIESRSERNFFKMTGQIPPTPTTGNLNEDEVYIRTEDLRSKCRVANGGMQPDHEEPAKSPKKKLFQNIRNPFSKASSSIAPPSMPSKAAQVLGTAARQPRIIQVRPIKPALPIQPTPAKPFRSETVKSLPAKIADLDHYAHCHHRVPSRRIHTGVRSTSNREGLKKQPSDAENNPPECALNASSDSMAPPPPPAKDTPPNQRPGSPLRRVGPAQDLRQSYDTKDERSAPLHFPNFNLSPPPFSDVVSKSRSQSPTKFRPYNAEDYTKLIVGEALQWPYPECTDSLSKSEGNCSAPLESASLEALRLPHPDRRSEDYPSSTRKQNSYSPLQPRFYSPKHLSAHGFLEGETPSKNTDKSRLLYSVPSKSASQLHLRKDSTNGSIRMIFQGDPRDIDPNSPTAREIDQNQQRARANAMQSDTGITTRIMQELRINEQGDSTSQDKGLGDNHHSDQSFSQLPDMPNAANLRASESHGDFQPRCPSAVPSPLHKAPVPMPAARPLVAPNASFGPFPPPLSPKSIDDHFFMTNEHLDVVGKTTWDLLEMFSKQHSNASKARHDELMALTKKYYDCTVLKVDAIADKINSMQESMKRLDSIARSHDNIYATLDMLKDNVSDGIPRALTDQDKRMASMEADIKELMQMLQALQNSSAEKTGQHAVDGEQNTTPNKGYAQGFGNHGPGPDLSNLHDNRSVMPPLDSQNDGRIVYQNGQWTARPGYMGRNSKEDRPSYPANPYHFANAGHYNAGYSGSYSPFGYSPGTADQQYPFNSHGQAK